MIADLYLNEINKWNISEYSKVRCITAFTFFKDLMVYLDYDFEENMESSHIKLKGHDCVRRDCFDCCMYKRAYAVFEDKNWIDQAIFIATAVESTAGWAISCGWDCLT